MKYYYSFDIETYTDDLKPELDTNKFKIGCVMDDKYKGEIFEDSETMAQYMLNKMIMHEGKKQKSYYYGHFSEYDFYGVFKKRMKKMITDGDLNIICTRPFIAIFYENHYILDLMSFYYSSLEEVGKMVGLPKLEMPEIYDRSELIPYVTRDCEIVIKGLEKMKSIMNEIGFNPRKYITAPSLSMNCFVSYLSKHEKAGWIIRQGVIHKNMETLNFIRQSVRGGYNMAFKTGKFKDCVYVDINSSYWRSMVEMDFPDLLKEVVIDVDDINHIGLNRVLERTCILNVKVKVPECGVGVLGVRHKVEEKGIYQQFFLRDGEVAVGTWTNVELKYALECGYEILEVYGGVMWKNNLNFNPLKEHILKLWDLRQKYKDNKLINHFVKLLGNGLYGKFMQRRSDKEYKWIERKDVQEYIDLGWRVESGELDYCISKEKSPYVPKYISMILSSLITAHARVNLIKQMREIPEEDLLYCDTDGIILKDKSLHLIDIGDELGQFKIEERGDCRINGEKKYWINEQVKISGLMKKQRKKEILDNEMEVETKRMIGYRQAIHFGGFDTIGTFETIWKRFGVSAKKDYILPEEIVEVDL